MKFQLELKDQEVRLSLTETLVLSEGQSAQLGLPDSRKAADLLPQIEAMARQFLSAYVKD